MESGTYLFYLIMLLNIFKSSFKFLFMLLYMYISSINKKGVDLNE